MRIRKKHLRTGLLLAALSSPFIFFSSPLTPWKQQQGLFHLWQELVFPIEYGWNHLLHGVHELWNTYFFLKGAAEENSSLKKELELLKIKLLDYDHQAAEVLRLRKLLGFSEHYQKDVTMVEVVGSSTGTPFQGLRIASGNSEDILVGMPVIAAQGVVGRVLRTGLHHADVQLVVDPNFNIDVIVERTRVRGVLHGLSENRCRLKLHRRADIRIGDTVVSSGITGGFPKGLPVGRIVKITYEADNISQLITIQPWVDYSGIEEVVVLSSVDHEIETIKETAGPDWVNAPPVKQRTLIR